MSLLFSIYPWILFSPLHLPLVNSSSTCKTHQSAPSPLPSSVIPSHLLIKVDGSFTPLPFPPNHPCPPSPPSLHDVHSLCQPPWSFPLVLVYDASMLSSTLLCSLRSQSSTTPPCPLSNGSL